jgi:hypothetical protein
MKKPSAFIFFVLFFALGSCLTFAQQPISCQKTLRCQGHLIDPSASQAPRNEWNARAFFNQKIHSLEILSAALRTNLSKHRNSPKRNEPTSFTSRLYAQFSEQKRIDHLDVQFGIRIYQNRYQIVPSDDPYIIRSQSIFVFQPSISSAYAWSGSMPVSIEYQAGLHVTPAPQLEKRMEFLHDGLPQRWLGWIGWVGKVAVKMDLPSNRQHRLDKRAK